MVFKTYLKLICLDCKPHFNPSDIILIMFQEENECKIKSVAWYEKKGEGISEGQIYESLRGD